MFTTALTTITTLEMILFCEHNVSFGAVVIVGVRVVSRSAIFYFFLFHHYGAKMNIITLNNAAVKKFI